MKDLGRSLEKKFLSYTDDERSEAAIDLLLAVDDLHSGKLSQTHQAYAHGDIKLDNVLVDQQGHLQLIDFGFTRFCAPN
ncbi:MAG: phosphotransferase [Gammaproteobacteria bacterium]|nr:phosphotransferase [Gammaproteobacteria bacterium]MCH9763640.1 phosphotransferase [Gammaproteobacteria bacterium]